MLQLFRKERVLPKAHDLRRTYDVVIIGAGVHGLATAYYLGKEHGITNVAVLEKSYLGAGNSGRNTAILRANYRTPEGIPSLQRRWSCTSSCLTSWAGTCSSASAGTSPSRTPILRWPVCASVQRRITSLASRTG